MEFKRGVWELGLGGRLYEIYDIDNDGYDGQFGLQFLQSPQFSYGHVKYNPGM